MAKVEVRTKWISEIYYQVKDWINLFMFIHRPVPFMIIIFSLTAPFAAVDAFINASKGHLLIHNILTFFGITYIQRDDKFGRFVSKIYIAVFEHTL